MAKRAPNSEPEKQAPPPSVRPAFCTIDSWLVISGMGRRATYDELGAGNLRAIKRGARTLVDVEHGLAWLRSLPMWQPEQEPKRHRRKAATCAE
jgi:hypothetical protein